MNGVGGGDAGDDRAGSDEAGRTEDSSTIVELAVKDAMEGRKA